MKLIKLLDIRGSYRWGEFYCEFCKNFVEKRKDSGIKAKSCGCIPKNNTNHPKKHGQCYSRLYRIWGRMLQRCLNIKYFEFHYYGGRGIIVCNEWLEFIPFRDWSLDNGYEENLQIDRKNTNGNYEPSNCHFVTPAENAQNKRNNKLNKEQILEIRQKYIPYKYTIEMLAKEYGIRGNYVFRIIKKEAWGNI